MKHQRLFALATGILLTAGTVSAQEKTQTWSLEDCLQYAYEQNIELKQSRLSLESSQIDTKNAKAKFFPNLSAGVSYQYTNTPFQETTGNDLDNYIITGNSGSDKNQLSGSYNLRSSLTLFNGGKLLNQVKSSKIAEEMQNASLEETFDNIESAIVTGYLQILYAQESVRINENTVEVSKAQCERGEKLKNAGSLSESDYAQLVSQYSNDKYQLVVSQNTLAQNILTLKQLLELGIDETIEIETPELDATDVLTPIASLNEIYQTALLCLPSIKYSELNIAAAKLDIKSAQSGYYPSLSLSAGVSTGHLSTSDGKTGSQMKNKLSESIGLSLSIPIYSNRDTRSAVSKARIAATTAELELESTKKTLLSDIENLCLDVKAAQEQYVSAREQVKASQASYDLIQEKFNRGMANTLELLTEKNNLLSAEQQVLQAKYMAILNRLLLNIYQNKPITL
ncbi:MAG TPA: TolC family protein [Candidatus Caccoplasma merdavium]|nr:TolC family protein [Candidatus Caccoplasma merdavium]